MPKRRHAARGLPVLLACLVACAPQPQARPEVRAIPLNQSDGATPPPERLGRLRLLRAYELRSSDRDFGGISGAALDGERLLLLSDRSRLFELAWSVDPPGGRSFSAVLTAERQLAAAEGQPLDAEALVLEPDHSLLVADEESGRLLRFAAGSVEPQDPPRQLPGAFAEPHAANDGVETVARLTDGSLLAISEGAWAGGDLHAAVRLGEDGPVALRYRAAEGFSPTDADAAGEHLFVLERRVSLFGGWQARVVAECLADLPDREGGVIEGEELALISGPELGENYEALAVRAVTDGSYRLVIVSDDNLNALQRTQLLELRWVP
ncbi:MAG TPA: esterase-like activity of phytase family protein [Geminicoccaceae bacterium]|nr:esterase-like activity of phytase family protein [Geminicoccaceae bacterium]